MPLLWYMLHRLLSSIAKALQLSSCRAQMRGCASVTRALCSSGNHGAALALAAQVRGIPATIIVPHTTPACKVAAIKAYGAAVVTCAASMDARETAMQAELSKCPEDQQPTFVPPYNGAATIAGQGTIALELLQQADTLLQCSAATPHAAGRDTAQHSRDLDAQPHPAAVAAGGAEATQRSIDAVVVPVSGGGMISGIASVIKERLPGCRVCNRCLLAVRMRVAAMVAVHMHADWQCSSATQQAEPFDNATARKCAATSLCVCLCFMCNLHCSSEKQSRHQNGPLAGYRSRASRHE